MKIMLVAICCIIMASLQLWQLIIFISEGFLSANFAGGENLYRAALPDLSASRLSDSLPNFFWHLPFYYDTLWVWTKLSHSVCNILTACKILKSLFFLHHDPFISIPPIYGCSLGWIGSKQQFSPKRRRILIKWLNFRCCQNWHILWKICARKLR